MLVAEHPRGQSSDVEREALADYLLLSNMEEVVFHVGVSLVCVQNEIWKQTKERQGRVSPCLR